MTRGGHDARDDDDETRGDDDDDDERYDALVNAEIRALGVRAMGACGKGASTRARWRSNSVGGILNNRPNDIIHFIHSFIHGCRSRG